MKKISGFSIESRVIKLEVAVKSMKNSQYRQNDQLEVLAAEVSSLRIEFDEFKVEMYEFRDQMYKFQKKMDREFSTVKDQLKLILNALAV